MMKVKEIMNKNVHTCDMDASLDAAAMIMWNNDCGCVPIVDSHGAPIGIVTDRDIAIGCALQHKPQWEIRVGDITNGHSLFFCKTVDDIADALQLMRKQGVRRLPVVNNSGKLAGIISLGDIVAHMEAKDSAALPLKQTLGMLKSVTGHHAELRVA